MHDAAGHMQSGFSREKKNGKWKIEEKKARFFFGVSGSYGTSQGVEKKGANCKEERKKGD